MSVEVNGTTDAALIALLDWAGDVLPVAVKRGRMQVGAMRNPVPHVSAMVLSDGSDYLPESATTGSPGDFDGGLTERRDISVLWQAYGDLRDSGGGWAPDWLAVLAAAWRARAGTAQELRDAGVYVYSVDPVLDVSQFLDTQYEPRAQMTMRAYVPRSFGVSDAVANTASVVVDIDLVRDGGEIAATVAVEEP